MAIPIKLTPLPATDTNTRKKILLRANTQVEFNYDGQSNNGRCYDAFQKISFINIGLQVTANKPLHTFAHSLSISSPHDSQTSSKDNLISLYFFRQPNCHCYSSLSSPNWPNDAYIFVNEVGLRNRRGANESLIHHHKIWFWIHLYCAWFLLVFLKSNEKESESERDREKEKTRVWANYLCLTGCLGH